MSIAADAPASFRRGDLRPEPLPVAREVAAAEAPEWSEPEAALEPLDATATRPPRLILRGALRDLRRTCGMAFVFSAAINVLMLTGSVYMLQVYDRVLASGSVETLFGLFAIVVVLYAFLGYFEAIRARLMGLAAVRLDREVGTAAFESWVASALRAPLQAVKAGPPGQPLRELETIRGFLSGGTLGALFDAPFVPLYLAVLFLLHPALGWITVGGALVTLGLAWLNHRLTREPIARTLAKEAAERDLAERARRSMETVHGMRMQAQLTARWQRLRDAALAASQASGQPGEILSAASKSFRMLLQSLILTAGALLVIRGEISGGMIVASSILSGRALAPVDGIIGGWRGIQRAQLAHRALGEAMGEGTATVLRVELPPPEGFLDVTNLTHLAAPDPSGAERRPILDDVTFSLEPGDGLAIVGPSGSGKSTLVRSLVGLLPPDRGEVRLDGATMHQWDPIRLGRHLGYLPQFPDPLPGTVRDIIARFDPALSDAAVIEAARKVGIHDMILQLPEGYATEIGGAMGPVLSGGQLQRLGLARALCGNPRLVVLDEPNSHLDRAGDEALGRAISLLREAGSVVIVVTHRPAALAALNKLLILEAGRLRRFGPLAEVMEQEGLSGSAGLARLGSRALGRAGRTQGTVGEGEEGKSPMPRAVSQTMRKLSDRRRGSGSPQALPASSTDGTLS